MNGNLQNMVQMVNMIKNGGPESFVVNAAKNSNNPILKQLAQYAEQGRNDKIEEFARNVCKEKGINFDEQFSTLRSIASNFR